MAVRGQTLADMERKGMIVAGVQVSLSSAQDPGVIVAAGTPVAVLAVGASASAANVFNLQSGGAASPANDFYKFELFAAGDFNYSFKHPLIMDGLALQWDNATSIRSNVQYKILTG